MGKGMGKGGAKKMSAKELAAAKKQKELDVLRTTSAIKDEHFKPIHQLAIELNTHLATGLREAEDVNYQKKRFGTNEIPHPKEKSVVVKIMEEQVGGFSFVMWLAAGCHLYSGYYLQDAEYTYAGTTMILMSVGTAAFLFGENYRMRPLHKPQYDLEKAHYYVKRHGRPRRIRANEIVVGDILTNLNHDQMIPADCRIISCDDHTEVNNSMFGAREASSIRLGEAQGGGLGAEENPMDAENMIWRGTDITNTAKIHEALVVKVGTETQAGRTLRLLAAIEEKFDHQSFTRNEIGVCSYWFSLFAIIVSVTGVAYMMTLPGALDSTEVAIVGASLLLACIPMGLLLSTMLTLRTSYSRMVAKGVKCKDIGSIEVMGGVSAIITQPSGPLTSGHEVMAALVFINDDGELHMTIPPSPYDGYMHLEQEVADECSTAGAMALQKNVLLTCADTRFVKMEEDIGHTRFYEQEQGSHKEVLKHAFSFRMDEKTGKRYRHFAWGMIGEETNCAAIRFYYEHTANFQIVDTPITHTTADGKVYTRHEKQEFDCIDVAEHYPRIYWSQFVQKRGFEIFVRASGPGKDATTNNSPRVVYIKGNPESVIARCRYMRDPTGPEGPHGLRPITAFDKKVLDDTTKRYSSEGLKVVAYAESEPLPLAKYSHAYNYSVKPSSTERYATANFPLGEDEDIPNVHPRSTGGLIFNGLICTYDEVHDTTEAMEMCRTGEIRVFLTTPENAENGLGLARKVGIVTEDNTDLDLIEHNEAIRNIVGTDASIEPNDFRAENERLASLPWESQTAVTQKMSEILTMPVEEIAQKGLNKFIDPDNSAATIIVADHVLDHKTNQYHDLEDMDQEWWERMIRNKPQVVISRCRPVHRQLLVLHLQRLEYTVALTGMGPEDSLSLEEADIGITTPEASTMVQSAADVILLGGHFTGIVELVKEGRLVYENLKKTTAFLTVSNVPQMVGLFSNVFLSLPLPINATLVLLVDLVTNMIPSIAMAGEPAEKPLMHMPPRKIKTEPIMTFKMIFFSYFQIGMIQAFAGMFAYFVVLSDYGFSMDHLYEGGPKGNWGNAPLYCKFDGGKYVNTRGEIDWRRNPTTQRPDALYPLWDEGDGGTVKECVHPIRNFQGDGSFSLSASPINIGLASSYFHGSFSHSSGKTTGRTMITVETLDALEYNGFYEYIPFKARMSAFWRDDWLSYDITQSRESLSSNQIPYRTEDEEDEHRDKRLQGADLLRYFQKASLGLWSICLADPEMEPAHKYPEERTSQFEKDGMKGFEDWLFAPSGNNGVKGTGMAPHKARSEGHATSRYSLWGWYVGDGGRHPTDDPADQIPYMSRNASAVGSTGCRREIKEHHPQAALGSMYTHALFCNGDQYRAKKQDFSKRKPGLSDHDLWLEERSGWKDKDNSPNGHHSAAWANETSVLREKCALLDDHHHQLAYCRTKCHYECPRIPANERFNTTGILTEVIMNSKQKLRAAGTGDDENSGGDPDAGLQVYDEGRTCQCANIASRMCQKEALYNARTAFLVAIVFCQIATIIAFKTRWLSVVEHGLGNPLLNVGLFASLMAMALATYSPMLNDIFSTRPIRFYHWMPGLPWACVIIVYDELRKFFMRKTSSKSINEETGETTRVMGWLEANTHY